MQIIPFTAQYFGSPFSSLPLMVYNGDLLHPFWAFMDAGSNCTHLPKALNMGNVKLVCKHGRLFF